MEFFKNCGTLSIYRFSQIIKNNNLSYLLKEYDDDVNEPIALVGNDLKEANTIFKEILYEYSQLTFNRSILLNYKSQINIAKEEFRYDLTERTLKYYEISEDLEVLKLLNSLEWNIDFEGDINKQILQVVNSMKRFRTRISLLKFKYEEKFKVKVKLGLEDEERDFADRLDEDAISLEMALKLSYSIDPKKISVSKWVSMFSVANKINKPKA